MNDMEVDRTCAVCETRLSTTSRSGSSSNRYFPTKSIKGTIIKIQPYPIPFHGRAGTEVTGSLAGRMNKPGEAPRPRSI